MDAAIMIGFTLLTILAIVTVVGHGIWVLLAKLFSGFAAPQTHRCPVCHAPLPMGQRHCQSCGWQPMLFNTDRMAALNNLRNIIANFGLRWQLDPQTRQSLMDAIEAQHRRWTEGAAQLSESPDAAPQAASSDVPAADEMVFTGDATARAPSEPVEALTVPPAAPQTIKERIDRFLEGRKSDEAPTENAAPPPRPTRSWSEVLAAFMEQRHIRWGELVGGLLIVFCSTALVISFWSDIAERPFLKFFVFNGVTAGLFGLGLYADRRWKLETTSHGVLLIAALLVPLNFLAIAAFSIGQAPLNVLTLGGEIFSVTLFATLLYFTARVVLREATILLTASVIVPSILTLVIRRHIDPNSPWWMFLAIAAALAICYTIANQWLLLRSRSAETVESDRALALLKLLGLSTFATALPVALLVYIGGNYRETLQLLAPTTAAFGLPAVALGLFCWRKLLHAEQAGHRTVGTSIGVLGTIIMLAGIALGWPDPQYMLPCAALNFLLLLLIAIIYSLPQVHLLSAACLSLSLLLGWLLARGRISWLMTPADMGANLASAESAVAMTGIAVVIAAFAGGISRLTDRRHAVWHLPVVCALAIASVVMVSVHGLGRVHDTSGAVWIYAFYAFLALVAATVVRRSAFSWLGCVLLLLALVQGVVFTYRARLPFADPWLAALLLHAAILTCIDVAFALTRFRSAAAIQPPCRFAALLTSLVAACYLAPLLPLASPEVPLQAFASLSAIWMLLALDWRKQILSIASQFALTAAVVFGVATAISGQAWVTNLTTMWLDPRSLQIQGLALVALALVWLMLRLLVRYIRTKASNETPRETWLRPFIQRIHPSIDLSPITLDRALIGIVLVLLLMLATYGATPGALVELSPVEVAADGTWIRNLPATEQFELAWIPHAPALGIGTWLLLAAVVALLLLSLRDRYPLWVLLAILLALSAAVPLLAGRFESQAAVASALRWFSAAYLLLGSIAVWSRHLWLGRLKAWGLMSFDPSLVSARQYAVTAIFVLTLAPLLIMLAYVSAAAMARTPPSDDSQNLLLLSTLVLTIGGAIAISLRRAVDIPRLTVNAYVARFGSLLLLLLCAAPLISVSLYVLAAALQQRPVHGPNPDAIFAQMGTAASYAVPIFVTAFVLVGYALRERDSGFSFAGGLLLCVAATAAYVLSIARAGGGLDPVQWVRLAQLNAAVAAIYGIAWVCVTRFGRPRELPAIPRDSMSPIHSLLATFVALPVALHVLVLLSATTTLFVSPVPKLFQLAAGDWAGWSSLFFSLSGGGLLRWHQFSRVQSSRSLRDLFASSILLLSAALLMTGLMIVCTTTHWDRGSWLSYHTLMIVLVASASSAPGLAWLSATFNSPEQRFILRGDVLRFSVVLAFIAFITAIAALDRDPRSPWPTVCAMGALAGLFIGLACGALRRTYLFASAILINIAVTLSGMELIPPSDQVKFVQLNVLALSLPVPLWVWIERTVLRPHALATRRFVSLHSLASWVATVTMLLVVMAGLLSDFLQNPQSTSSWIGWIALAVTTIAIISCHWDEEMRSTVAGLYVVGLVGCAALVDAFDLSPNWLLWIGSITLAAYSVATSYLWSRREGLSRTASLLGIPISDRLLTAHRWILPANGLLVLCVVVLGFSVQLNNDDLSQRILSAKAILAQALAIGLLARGERRTPLQYAALVVGTLGAVAFSWSWLDPRTSGTVLNYAVNALAAIVVTMTIYGIGFSKIMRRTNEWTAAAERFVPLLAVLGIIDVVVILSQEVTSFVAGVVPLNWAGITIVSVSLLGIAVSCLAAALIPGRDPFRLTERQRTVYIYVTEAVLAMLFLHLRVTMPWLFRGWLMQYWPMIVMLLAFIGVALSELFRRQRREILAEPLERTGALLPLLPALAFWHIPSTTHFSIVMLAAGGIYMALAALRRSFTFGVMAALAANVGLWYFLHHTGVTTIWQHPQLWLIPPALCVLVAAYLNQDRLSESQLASLRYASAAAIYVSSTADIFLNGVANAPWLPLVLGAISLAGIFSGILLRIRGFLFLGTAFLILALFTIIWYAAVDLRQTWIWAVTGIITGVLIIALFAVFEKKRQEVLRLVENLKEWRP